MHRIFVCLMLFHNSEARAHDILNKHYLERTLAHRQPYSGKVVIPKQEEEYLRLHTEYGQYIQYSIGKGTRTTRVAAAIPFSFVRKSLR